MGAKYEKDRGWERRKLTSRSERKRKIDFWNLALQLKTFGAEENQEDRMGLYIEKEGEELGFGEGDLIYLHLM